MHSEERNIYDRLVAAGWLENVAVPSPEKRNLVWFVSDNPLECGNRKIILFAGLYRELLKGGPMGENELNLIRQLGEAIGGQAGLDMSH